MIATPHKSVPTLRFKDDNGRDYLGWEDKRLGELYDITSSKRVFQSEWKNSGVPFYRAREIIKLSENGKVDNDLFISLNMYREYSEKYGAPKENDLLVTGVGTIGKLYVVPKKNTFYIKDGNIVWFKNKNKASSAFVKYLFNTRYVEKQLIDNASITTVATYTIESAKKTKVRIPTLEEQQKIAAFLSAADTRIEQLNRKKSLLAQYKQGMMQKLFCQEIRFKDDEGKDFPDWGSVELRDVLDYVQPTAYLVDNSEYDDSFDTPVLTAGKTFLLGYTNEKSGIFKDNLPVIIFDDFTTAFQYVDFPFKAKSSAMKMLVPDKNDVNMKFVYEAMKRIRFPLGEHKRYWISEYQKEKIMYPCKREQQKIAGFLSSIDRKIELVTSQSEQAQSFKKGLLQQMFI